MLHVESLVLKKIFIKIFREDDGIAIGSNDTNHKSFGDVYE